MSRLRYTNAIGTISIALASDAGPDTINFSVAPPFATIASPDYIPLILDPPQGLNPNPSFEVVWLTAYTAGATTGTITRGQDGTTVHGHNAGAAWVVGPTGTDFMGQPPVGAQVPYAGSGDPPEGTWVIGDGRLIDAVVYGEFDKRAGSGGGHKYNGGVAPGTNGLGHAQVRIPDKRGKKSIGAINMGSALGAGANNNSHHQATQGTSYGEVNHALTSTEGPVHNHWSATGGMSANNPHGHLITDPNHQHVVDNLASSATAALDIWQSGDGHGAFTSPGVGSQGTHYVGTGITINSQDISHTHTIPWDGGNTPTGGGSAGTTTAHNNVDPCEADCWIVRIA